MKINLTNSNIELLLKIIDTVPLDIIDEDNEDDEESIQEISITQVSDLIEVLEDKNIIFWQMLQEINKATEKNDTDVIQEAKYKASQLIAEVDIDVDVLSVLMDRYWKYSKEIKKPLIWIECIKLFARLYVEINK